MTLVRSPAVAGMFYPDDPVELRRGVIEMIDAAMAEVPPDAAGPLPKAIIAPHAGYVYSGPIAAAAYAAIAPERALVRRVVLLGPAHRVWVAGLALPGVDMFETPLGRIPVDQAAVEALRRLPQVETLSSAHAAEHSLEVHLPFLQTVLNEFTLVPLVVGGASPEQVAEVLELLWGGDETLIVVSSDLSHYLPYRLAQQADQATVDEIVTLNTDLRGDQACGAHPVNGLLLAARRKGLHGRVLDMRNSGDTAGDKDRVVGYAAIAFTE